VRFFRKGQRTFTGTDTTYGDPAPGEQKALGIVYSAVGGGPLVSGISVERVSSLTIP